MARGLRGSSLLGGGLASIAPLLHNTRFEVFPASGVEDAATVAALLPAGLRSFMGPVFPDVDRVSAVSADTVEIRLHRASPLFTEKGQPERRSTRTGTRVALAGMTQSTIRRDRPHCTSCPYRSHGKVKENQESCSHSPFSVPQEFYKKYGVGRARKPRSNNDLENPY